MLVIVVMIMVIVITVIMITGDCSAQFRSHRPQYDQSEEGRRNLDSQQKRRRTRMVERKSQRKSEHPTKPRKSMNIDEYEYRFQIGYFPLAYVSEKGSGPEAPTAVPPPPRPLPRRRTSPSLISPTNPNAPNQR